MMNMADIYAPIAGLNSVERIKMIKKILKKIKENINVNQKKKVNYNWREIKF